MTRARTWAVIVYAVVSGVWIFATQHGGNLLDTTPAGICFVALGIGVGALVRRWWVFLAVVGPLLALGYLEATGFTGTGDDWAAEPLLSPPGVFLLVSIAAILLLGWGVGEGIEALWTWRRERRRVDSEAW
jgi:hypothetical protein